jgi:hypothetical protein
LKGGPYANLSFHVPYENLRIAGSRPGDDGCRHCPDPGQKLSANHGFAFPEERIDSQRAVHSRLKVDAKHYGGEMAILIKSAESPYGTIDRDATKRQQGGIRSYNGKTYSSLRLSTGLVTAALIVCRAMLRNATIRINEIETAISHALRLIR